MDFGIRGIGKSPAVEVFSPIMLRRWSATFTLCSLLAADTARAVDRYVSTSGNDANPGTLASPLRTINVAITQSSAGDTILVRAGVYDTERVLIAGKNGTAAQPVTLRSYPGETAILDRSLNAPPNGDAGLLEIVDSSHIIVEGLEIRNFKTSNSLKVPIGIFVHGSGTGVRLIGNKVHDIWQSSTGAGDAFGIAVKGTAATAIDQLVLEGNEVYNLRTGSSESVVLNGNVTNFTVRNNVIHDCNNIGIDFIGFEGVNSNVALDRARGGVCAGNVVYNVDSQFNPAYGGNFTGTFATQDDRNAARSAPGIYVDGGQDITIERNLVHGCNMGASIGSENSGRASDNIRFRNNILRDNHVGGIFLGGAGAGNGGTSNTSITNNTLYRNDTELYGGGAVAIQHNVSSTTIKNNIMVASADGGGWAQFVLKTSTNGSFAANAINWNIYSGASAANNLEFIWNGTARSSFSAWKTSSSQDANSTFITASLGFANAAANDFSLASSSPARDAGDASFSPAPGEKDFGGQSRVAGARVDAGADEFMTSWQAWRDLHFQLPDGGAGANAADDFDKDGHANLLEYSQAMNPTISDQTLAPSAQRSGGNFRFTYRKSAPELSYQVETSTTLANPWTATGAAEQTDGSGNYWRDFTMGDARFFVRLKVTQP